MTLSWKEPKAAPDPFAASVGDRFTYEVYYGRSSAVTDQEIETDLTDVVRKALPFLREMKGERAVNVLLLWDAVYCTLTIVCSDEQMMNDASTVIKCGFDSLEAKTYELEDDVFDEQTAIISTMIKKMLSRILAAIDTAELPTEKPIYFSDEDRPSVGDKFLDNVVKM